MRTIITRDDGAARLGEVALVDREGRIGALDTVFYDTLLDENAASHIALGRAFPFLADDEETASRMNESDIHIDFMIGRPELTVTGITTDGDRVPGARRRRLADLDRASLSPVLGEVPERLNGHDWKSCDGETRPGVRIPLSPLRPRQGRLEMVN